MRSLRELFRHRDGSVFVEFLVAFIPLWIFFLCVVQLALIARASLMVRHAADAAARSAAVVLPDDPSEYAGEPEMSVARRPFTSDDLLGLLGQVVPKTSGVPASPGQSRVALINAGRSRLNTIRLAAHVPLLSLAPRPIGSHAQPSIRGALGEERGLLYATRYQPFALAVTFPDVEGDTATGPEITVRVTYAYACIVPIARNILCDPFGDLPSRGDYQRAFLPVLSLLVRGRFRELSHETTALIHDAPYAYRTRGS